MTTTATRTPKKHRLSPKLIREIVRRVLTVSSPQKIILFGSAATGEMTKDSDIDLLIVEQRPGNVWDRSVRIRHELRGIGYPFDVIVMSARWFEETKDLVDGIARPASTYGRVIYEAP